MSDAEEDLSSGSICSMSKNSRKLPHRNASAAAKKKLLYNSEDDQSLKTGSEKELKHPNQPALESYSGAARKSVREAENGSSESENNSAVSQKNWQANGYKAHAATGGPTKFPLIESSEDSEGYNSGNDSKRTPGPSTSTQKSKARRSSRENVDSEPGEWSGRRCKRACAVFRKAKVLSDSEDSAEEQRGGKEAELGSTSRNSRELRDAPLAVSRPYLEHESETDLDSDHSYRGGAGARKRTADAMTDSVSQENGHSGKASRKRICSSDSDSNSEEVKPSKGKIGFRRIPRRCAAMAANKIRLMSDEEDFNSEHLCTRSNGYRKKALNCASTKPKATSNGSEGNASLKSETLSNEQSTSEDQLLDTGSDSSRKNVGESVHEDLDSESSQTWRSARLQPSSAASHAIKNALLESSHGSSKSHKPEDANSGKGPYQSPLAQRSTSENSVEEEMGSGVGKWRGKRTRRKTSQKVLFRKAKVPRGLQDTTESEKGRKRKCSESEILEASEKTSSSKTSPKCESDLGTETDSDTTYSDNVQTNKRKRNRKANVLRRGGNTFKGNLSKPMRLLRKSKRPRLRLDDNDWEDLDYAKTQRAPRRSKIRTRNQGRRTVRYNYGDDDRVLDVENVFDTGDCTL
uniref:Bromodomain and WD repeat domain containing 1 n=1 Tax=Monodelphis domestica TaxID=13616 RepID=A0A5F8HK52_MONDO